MRDFRFHRPADTTAAAKIVAEAEEPKLLAGGMTLIPVLKQRLAAPTDLIDLSSVSGLTGIAKTANGLSIGAMTRHAEVNTSSVVTQTIPSLAELAGQIADPAVRNRGTIGGSIANADPAADYPAAVVALKATVRTTKRAIASDDFFTGFYATALEPGEIITAVEFLTPLAAKYMKLRHPASGYAVTGVYVARYSDGVRVAVTGAGPSVFRLKDFEAALTKSFTVKAIEGLSVSASDLLSDIHHSAEYRASVTAVMAKRAVAALV
jgi:carbon-monoxide dehydrogenase medium subunit